jgi:hypothetical protein
MTACLRQHAQARSHSFNPFLALNLHLLIYKGWSSNLQKTPREKVIHMQNIGEMLIIPGNPYVRTRLTQSALHKDNTLSSFNLETTKSTKSRLVSVDIAVT